MLRSLAIAGVLWALLWAATGQAHAALILNAARPIVERVNVNLIAVADNNGSNSTAGTFGTATQQASVFSLVDDIYEQAGVDVEFAFRAGTYNSTFARTGTPGGNNPRPQGDLNTILSNAAAAGGILSANANTINVFLVSIVPGFSQLSDNSSAGLATVGGNGVTYFGGVNLLDFEGGREVLASVLAHEIGHNLGLDHMTLTENLMRASGAGNGQRLTESQIQLVLASPFTVTAPSTPGDFNRDGRVDGADFLSWQRGETTPPRSASDLALWRTNYGKPNSVNLTHPVLAPVPEPSALLLVVACAVTWAMVRPQNCRASGSGAISPSTWCNR